MEPDPNETVPTATARDPYLMVVRNGPYYSLDFLEHWGRTLSQVFEGELCTFGPQPAELDFGRFRILRLKLRDGAGMLARAVYGIRVLRRALIARWIRRRRLVVITYDPFFSGAIGLLAKWTTGARFVCEVNGVYGDPDNLIDMQGGGVREKKRARMLRIGSFVLRRSDMIKLLFPGQLEGFSVPDDHPPRVHFFDIINEDLFGPGGTEPEKQLLFVGHPFLRKGVDILLEAFARVRDHFPTWSLVIVGWRIEEAARSKPYPLEGVTFLGPQTPGSLSEWMGKSRALVLPSRSEGMGRVLLEAAFKGRARIGSRTGGIPHFIEDGTDGLLFECGNVDDLESKLRRFMSDTDLQERMGEAALRRARMEFTSAEYVRRYQEVISIVMSPHR